MVAIFLRNREPNVQNGTAMLLIQVYFIETKAYTKELSFSFVSMLCVCLAKGRRIRRVQQFGSECLMSLEKNINVYTL
jgi:hypothetical protein